MYAQTIPPAAQLDLDAGLDTWWEVNLARFSLIRFQPVLASGTWTTAVIEVETNLDSANMTAGGWVPLRNIPEQDGPAAWGPLADSTITKAYFIGALQVIRFRVDIAQPGTPGKVAIYCVADATSIAALTQRTGP